MRYAVCAMMTAMVVLGASPGALFAQQSGDASSGEQMSAEERARKVEKLAAEGAKAYGEGDYDRAVDHFQRAHALEPVPNLLYNIAKSYEKQEKYEQAVTYYQKFVVAPEVDSKARQAALKRIDSLREIADLKEDENANGDDSGGGDSNVKSSFEPTEPAESSNATAKWTMGGGAALLGAGAIVGLTLASPAADKVRTGATYADRKAAQEDARTSALVADGLFATGAVVTAVGMYLYFSDSEAAPEQTASEAVVTPWITSSSAGVGMSLDF